ncbi:hypothetical protein [Butyrivibrio sp. NC3005]|uniref:hypothetical protein n=1 Tax=Butyrivibrio sp. NC3005 TaxID=1280685 RepID=UPI000479F24B|nr:hypothetical protein [Butyrivibrio sp. NC3005]
MKDCNCWHEALKQYQKYNEKEPAEEVNSSTGFLYGKIYGYIIDKKQKTLKKIDFNHGIYSDMCYNVIDKSQSSLEK